MKYADMHCDTLTELYLGRYGIDDAPLHISLADARNMKPYIQTGAVWTDNDLTNDEAYDRFFEVIRHIRRDPAVTDGRLRLCRRAAELDSAIADGVPAIILAVEGARLTDRKISRLADIADEGVRLITLQWSGSDCIGGAWDTDDGLTPYGRELLRKMAEYGIAADISHASDRCAAEILDAAEEYGIPVCASHSNSRAVCSHRRNLADELFRRVKSLGGVVGISMAPQHLSDSGIADINDVRRHIYHYLDIGGEDTVCLGCDFDGISTTPQEICGIKDLEKLREHLSQDGLSDIILNKLFFGNAHRFIRGILG